MNVSGLLDPLLKSFPKISQCRDQKGLILTLTLKKTKSPKPLRQRFVDFLGRAAFDAARRYLGRSGTFAHAADRPRLETSGRCCKIFLLLPPAA